MSSRGLDHVPIHFVGFDTPQSEGKDKGGKGFKPFSGVGHRLQAPKR